LRVMGYEFRVASYGLRVSGCELWVTGYGGTEAFWFHCLSTN
jgi:hypothetical protein